MPALALISDLMMASHVKAAAERAGIETELVNTAEALVSRSETIRPRLVIVDLSHPGLEVLQLAQDLRGHLPDGAMTIAFGPHVHKDRLTAAADAGFGLVLSRGAFHAEADEILKRHG
jgi:DNA-binding response OmpR family regulator